MPRQRRPAAQPKPAKKIGETVKKLKTNDEFSTGKAKALRVKALALGNSVMTPVAQSLSAADQAAADADRLAKKAKTDPQGAAAELKTAMLNPDPAYHEALLSESRRVVGAIA